MGGRVITVSSGGMYTQPLNNNNMQNEQFASSDLSSFDGTSAYAHSKRQQICLTKKFAQVNPKLLFFSMHPAWTDTPGVEKSLPSFHERLKDKLRTPEQGADTIIYLS